MTLINLKNSHLNYTKQTLCLGDYPLDKFAELYPTPFYLYDISILRKNYQVFLKAMRQELSTSGLICFAVKSNNHPRVLKELSDLGSGADVVSIGELEESLKAGFPAKKIVFSGAGKTDEEILRSISITKGELKSLNVESIDELESIIQISNNIRTKINISLRLNPATPGKTHQHISTGGEDHKFGLLEDEIEYCINLITAQSLVACVGISMHIGSQLTCMGQTIKSFAKLINISSKLSTISTLNVGGGLGVHYDTNSSSIVSIEEYMKTVSTFLEKRAPKNVKEIIFEPGRYISATCGVLVTKVIREKRFFRIVDAGMNDLIRPALYGANHEIYPILKPNSGSEKIPLTIAGPICETGDFFTRNRLSFPVKKGDFLVISNTGAYGRVLASSYNSRQLIKEYFTD